MLNLSLACMVADEYDPDPGWESREPLNQICGRREWGSRAVVLEEEGAGRPRSSEKVGGAHDVGGEGRRRRVLVEMRRRSIPRRRNLKTLARLCSSYRGRTGEEVSRWDPVVHKARRYVIN